MKKAHYFYAGFSWSLSSPFSRLWKRDYKINFERFGALLFCILHLRFCFLNFPIHSCLKDITTFSVSSLFFKNESDILRNRIPKRLKCIL